MAGFGSFNLFDPLSSLEQIPNFFAPTPTSKSKTDDDDDYELFRKDSDDEGDSKPSSATINPVDNIFGDLLNVKLPDLVSNLFVDQSIEQEKKRKEKAILDEQERKEFEAEEIQKRKEVQAARRRKEEEEELQRIENERRKAEVDRVRKEELAKQQSTPLSSKASFSFFSKRSSTPSSNDVLSSEVSIPTPPASVKQAQVLDGETSEGVADVRSREDILKSRTEAEKLHLEREAVRQKLRQEQEQLKKKEAEERVRKEEQEHLARLEKERHQKELLQFEKLRQEQDLRDKKKAEKEKKKLEEAEFKRIQEEQEKDKKLRDLQTRKISKIVQKQIDRQEIHRLHSSSDKPAISRELVQKITEVQVAHEVEETYAKRKEEEYAKIKANKIREAEEKQLYNNTVGWIVGAIAPTPPTPEATTKSPTVFNPYDEKRSPFEKHLTDVGFRVTLHKYKTVDEFYAPKDRDDDRKIEASLTRKAILRYDPSFNSLYLDVKVEGHSTVLHFNIVRDIRKVVRGVKAGSHLRIEGQSQDTTKYISLTLSGKMDDAIMEFESVKAANSIFPELTNFVAFRKEYPTVDVGLKLHPDPKHTDVTVGIPSILPAASLPYVFDIASSITPKLLNAPIAANLKHAILSTETITDIGKSLVQSFNDEDEKKEDDDDDDDDDDNENEEGEGEDKPKKTKSMRDILDSRVLWHQWIRLYTATGGTKYRLLVLGSNGRGCYYSLKEDIRDDDIIPGLDAMKKGLWDENRSLFDLGYKKESRFSRRYVLTVSPTSTSSEPYQVELRFIDLTSLTIICDSEAKWKDAVLSIRSFCLDTGLTY